MRLIYDLLAITSFIFLCGIAGNETISVLETLLLGAAALAACWVFVRLGDKCDKSKHTADNQKDNRGKAA